MERRLLGNLALRYRKRRPDVPRDLPESHFRKTLTEKQSLADLRVPAYPSRPDPGREQAPDDRPCYPDFS